MLLDEIVVFGDVCLYSDRCKILFVLRLMTSCYNIEGR
jgi:hypothetical protein